MTLKPLYGSNIVPPVGPVPCPLMYIGEAPGPEEDLYGEPFVGVSGRLLTTASHQAGFKRKNIYITNAVKCRPPENRMPTFEEILEHREFLLAEIEVVKPRVIVCLGQIALKALKGQKFVAPVDSGRQKIHIYRGIKVVFTYHPAATLLAPERFGVLVDDLHKAFEILNKPANLGAGK